MLEDDSLQSIADEPKSEEENGSVGVGASGEHVGLKDNSSSEYSIGDVDKILQKYKDQRAEDQDSLGSVPTMSSSEFERVLQQYASDSSGDQPGSISGEVGENETLQGLIDTNDEQYSDVEENNESESKSDTKPTLPPGDEKLGEPDAAASESDDNDVVLIAKPKKQIISSSSSELASENITMQHQDMTKDWLHRILSSTGNMSSTDSLTQSLTQSLTRSLRAPLFSSISRSMTSSLNFPDFLSTVHRTKQHPEEERFVRCYSDVFGDGLFSKMDDDDDLCVDIHDIYEHMVYRPQAIMFGHMLLPMYLHCAEILQRKDDSPLFDKVSTHYTNAINKLYRDEDLSELYIKSDESDDKKGDMVQQHLTNFKQLMTFDSSAPVDVDALIGNVSDDTGMEFDLEQLHGLGRDESSNQPFLYRIWEQVEIDHITSSAGTKFNYLANTMSTFINEKIIVGNDDAIPRLMLCLRIQKPEHIGIVNDFLTNVPLQHEDKKTFKYIVVAYNAEEESIAAFVKSIRNNTHTCVQIVDKYNTGELVFMPMYKDDEKSDLFIYNQVVANVYNLFNEMFIDKCTNIYLWYVNAEEYAKDGNAGRVIQQADLVHEFISNLSLYTTTSLNNGYDGDDKERYVLPMFIKMFLDGCSFLLTHVEFMHSFKTYFIDIHDPKVYAITDVTKRLFMQQCMNVILLFYILGPAFNCNFKRNGKYDVEETLTKIQVQKAGDVVEKHNRYLYSVELSASQSQYERGAAIHRSMCAELRLEDIFEANENYTYLFAYLLTFMNGNRREAEYSTKHIYTPIYNKKLFEHIKQTLLDVGIDCDALDGSGEDIYNNYVDPSLDLASVINIDVETIDGVYRIITPKTSRHCHKLCVFDNAPVGLDEGKEQEHLNEIRKLVGEVDDNITNQLGYVALDPDVFVGERLDDILDMLSKDEHKDDKWFKDVLINIAEEVVDAMDENGSVAGDEDVDAVEGEGQKAGMYGGRRKFGVLEWILILIGVVALIVLIVVLVKKFFFKKTSESFMGIGRNRRKYVFGRRDYTDSDDGY